MAGKILSAICTLENWKKDHILIPALDLSMDAGHKDRFSTLLMIVLYTIYSMLPTPLSRFIAFSITHLVPIELS